MADTEEPVSEGRRNFLRLVAVAAVGVTAVGLLKGGISDLIAPTLGLTSFPTLTIYDTTGKPLLYENLPVNSAEVYEFFYPLSNEPSFLLKLGDKTGKPLNITTGPTPKSRATGVTYTYPAGVGPSGEQCVFAFSGICQHAGCIPPSIKYYPPGFTIPGYSSSYVGQSGLIHCSCHGSTYDPAEGATIVTGPTQNPLPGIYLEYNATTHQITAMKQMYGPYIYGHTSDLTGGAPLGTSYTPITIIKSG